MKRILYILSILIAFTACRDRDWVETGGAKAGDIINVGGVTSSPLKISVSENATRANHVQDAETVDWLIRPLKEGLDVTYGKVSDDPEKRQEKVAILKLTGGTADDNNFATDAVTGWAIYSFKYKGTNDDAIWYDNGEHYFQGMFVPDNLRYGEGAGDGRGALSSVNTISAPNITTDQSNPTNYSFLEHYLAMPADTKIHATVGRVKLPFYHRLSRVIAYILIDPEMSPDPAHPVTLKGFKLDAEGNPTATEDPTTTSLRFCNVNVLTGVHDKLPSDAAHTHELTPHWESKRKVIPHFEAEEGSMVQNATGDFTEQDENFYMFYDDKTQEYLFPTMEKWADYYTRYKDATDQQLETAKVTRTNYGKVPVYDLIVRPTYTAENTVMYDEHNSSDQPLSTSEKRALVDLKNKIEFELTLSNGLIYTKEFEFDLNANEQTVVYLRISRESVDYNASGSETWTNKQKDDDWYGIDNQLGHSLSQAGSSWQRAYTYSATVSDDKVTDGGFYNENTVGEDGTVGQYVTLATWKKKFAQAYEGGECHGDYFMLTSDISISAKELPDNFVFTGHLDAHGHTITITATGQQWEEWNEATTTDYSNVGTTLYTAQNKANVYTMPSPLFTMIHHDAVPYEESELTEVEGVKYVTTSLTHIPASDAVLYADVDEYNTAKGTSLGADEFEALSNEEKIKTPAVVEHYEVNGGSILGTTPKVPAYDEYLPASPTRGQLLTADNGTYYTRSGEEGSYTYPPYDKPEHLYTELDHISGSALFAGLNGAYTAADGVANVHREGGVLVPYTDGTTGWRAEVMNLRVSGKLFADDVYTPDAASRTGYNVLKVSGNVDNCYDTQGKVPNHRPALFKY